MAYDTSKEIFVAGRGAQTDNPVSFCVECAYKESVAVETPMIVFSPKSGFKLSIIGGGNWSAFIKRTELQKVMIATEVCESLLCGNSTSDKPVGKCYDYIFRMGDGFKGKSPAEIYINKEKTLDEIKKQGNYLYTKAKEGGKYASSNMEGCEAVKDLISRIENGTLEKNVGNSVIAIHGSGTRYFPKEDEDGYRQAWELEITCSLNSASPYDIKIERSKVKVSNNHMIQEKIDAVSKNISLTRDEWLCALREMDMFDKALYNLLFKGHYDQMLIS